MRDDDPDTSHTLPTLHDTAFQQRWPLDALQPVSKQKMRCGEQSQTRLDSFDVNSVPLDHGENAGMIQHFSCCTNAGSFSRIPAPSPIIPAG